MTGTAGVTTARTFRMSIRTSFAAISLTFFHQSIAQVNNTQALGTSALHLSHCCHGKTSQSSFLIILTYEQ